MFSSVAHNRQQDCSDKKDWDVELRRRSLDGVDKDIGQKCDENGDNTEPCYAAPETKHGRILVLQFAMPLDEI